MINISRQQIAHMTKSSNAIRTVLFKRVKGLSHCVSDSPDRVSSSCPRFSVVGGRA